MKIEGVETLVEPVREYRLVVRFRGEGLGDNVADTDPLSTGLHTLEPRAGDPGSEKTAKVAAEFLRQAKLILKDESPANFLMMRGFAKFPAIATMEEVYGLNGRRHRRLPDVPGPGPPGGDDRRRARQDPGRPVRSRQGRSGTNTTSSSSTTSTPTAPARTATSPRRSKMIEALDAEIPKLMALKPDVLIVTGDHSTPSRMKSHSFHPVPLLLWAPATSRPDLVTTFGERPCLARRPRADPRQGHHAPGDGPRRPAPEVRGLRAKERPRPPRTRAARARPRLDRRHRVGRPGHRKGDVNAGPRVPSSWPPAPPNGLGRRALVAPVGGLGVLVRLEAAQPRCQGQLNDPARAPPPSAWRVKP